MFGVVKLRARSPSTSLRAGFRPAMKSAGSEDDNGDESEVEADSYAHFRRFAATNGSE